MKEKTLSAPIIKSRFKLMGEGVIPNHALSFLSENEVKTFLTEPDLSKWPPSLAHLKAYLQGQEGDEAG